MVTVGTVSNRSQATTGTYCIKRQKDSSRKISLLGYSCHATKS